MPNPNQPNRPKTTEEILREMEEMSDKMGKKSAPQPVEAEPAGKAGGGLKSLLNFFIKVVPDEESPATAAKTNAPPPQPNAPPRPRVADLVANEPAPKFAAPANDTNDVGDLAAKPFEEIYRAAGLADSPCNVDELAQLLENPTIANQPLNVKVVAVNLTLSAKGLSLEAPITDAMRRDRALDAYQAMLGERAQASDQRNQTLIQQITQETEAFLKRKQAEMDALRAESAAAQQQSVAFAQRREAEEQRLANLISPFLEGKPNPVSVGDAFPTKS